MATACPDTWNPVALGPITAAVKALLEQAMQLSPEERAEVARVEREELATAWRTELNRRASSTRSPGFARTCVPRAASARSTFHFATAPTAVLDEQPLAFAEAVVRRFFVTARGRLSTWCLDGLISATVPMMSRSSPLWPVLGALVVGGIAATIAYLAASHDIDNAVTNGPARFVGMAGGIGLCVGWYVTLLLTRGARVARHGITLSYQRIEPMATSYREIAMLTVDDLLAKLREVGYEPTAKACDEFGTVRGPIESSTPLAGANVAITDPKVKGWIRVQLAPPPEDSARAMGLIETWTTRGEAAGELALFALRALDGLLGQLTASYDDSAL